MFKIPKGNMFAHLERRRTKMNLYEFLSSAEHKECQKPDSWWTPLTWKKLLWKSMGPIEFCPMSTKCQFGYWHSSKYLLLCSKN